MEGLRDTVRRRTGIVVRAGVVVLIAVAIAVGLSWATTPWPSDSGTETAFVTTESGDLSIFESVTFPDHQFHRHVGATLEAPIDDQIAAFHLYDGDGTHLSGVEAMPGMTSVEFEDVEGYKTSEYRIVAVNDDGETVAQIRYEETEVPEF